MLHKVKVLCGLALWLLCWVADGKAGFIPGDMYASSRLGAQGIAQVGPSGGVFILEPAVSESPGRHENRREQAQD
jgi:hypothetical protein